MIDERQTREFPKFCKALCAAELGNMALQQEILENGRVADSQMDRILASAPIMLNGIEELSKQFTKNELTAIRKRKPFPRSLIEKATKFMTELALLTLSCHPNPPPPFREPIEMWNLFHFRHALCAFVWSLDWISQGGAGSVRTDKIRNDLIDVIFVTYATYFDGLISKDAKVLRVHSRADFILRSITGKT
jgi:hypothetical protein